MPRNGAPPKEVAVPVAVFASLRSELEAEVGTLPTVHALHNAGYRAGTHACSTLHVQAGGDVYKVSRDGFWDLLRSYFADRGWGTLEHSATHDAIGVLSSQDWAEASADANDPDAGCSFSSGFLSGLLSQVAGGPIAVLETSCRTRGDGSCDFVFGSEAVVHDLYGRILDGADLAGALEAL